MRLVLDTNVAASALLWGGVPACLLREAQARRVRLFTSTPLLLELSKILGRPKFGKKIAASLMSIEQLVDCYAALADVVRPTPVAGIAPDPDDDVVIGTALAARADWIVTGDHDLLSIREHQGVFVGTVSDTLALIDPTGR
jgi:putative PIN family toxin of toxin-antitoxin system